MHGGSILNAHMQKKRLELQDVTTLFAVRTRHWKNVITIVLHQAAKLILSTRGMPWAPCHNLQNCKILCIATASVGLAPKQSEGTDTEESEDIRRYQLFMVFEIQDCNLIDTKN